MSKDNLNICFTPGDVHGIGPEVVLKAMVSTNIVHQAGCFLLGDFDFYQQLAGSLQLVLPLRLITKGQAPIAGYANVMPVPAPLPEMNYSGPTEATGRYALEALRLGVQLAQAGRAHGLVTGPVHKEAIALGFPRFRGQTEFIQGLVESEGSLMMLVSGALRVGLVTTHLAISEVAKAITKASIKARCEIMHRSLQFDFGIASPRIAVLSLNPHAGEGGTIGTEEINTVIPALQELQQNGIVADGPFPADGFFGNRRYLGFDAVLAMYHDQGLAPFKALSFGNGVNMTCGLPIVRTSPDHGTAFDLAGTGKASPTSTEAAIALALETCHHRQSRRQA